MSILLSAALNPLFTGPLLWALSDRAPSVVRERVLAVLAKLPFKLNLKVIASTLKWLAGIGLAGALNRFLSACALNGWRIRGDKKRWNWPNEIAVVTGGCSGFGAAITAHLVARGVSVAILDVSPLPSRFSNEKRIHYIRCDITDSDAVSAAADEVRSTFGKPSILVNNAGIGASHPVLSANLDMVRKTIAVNLTSHWYTCGAFVPDMVKANKGHIVTLASVASFITVAGTVDYAATKSGVLAFHEGLSAALRNEYKAPQVHTTCVHPTFAKTAMLSKLTPEQLKKLGQVLDAEDVAKPVVDAIFSCRGGQLIIPSAPLYAIIRAWPSWLQEGFRDMTAKIENFS